MLLGFLLSHLWQPLKNLCQETLVAAQHSLKWIFERGWQVLVVKRWKDSAEASVWSGWNWVERLDPLANMRSQSLLDPLGDSPRWVSHSEICKNLNHYDIQNTTMLQVISHVILQGHYHCHWFPTSIMNFREKTFQLQYMGKTTLLTLKAAAYAACKFDMPSNGNLLWMSSHKTIAKL